MWTAKRELINSQPIHKISIFNDHQQLTYREVMQLWQQDYGFRSFFISPPKASDDAVHIAAATVHGVDYLLTWNCKHIANAQIQRKLAEISLDLGYELPIICTPYELLGDYNDVGR